MESVKKKTIQSQPISQEDLQGGQVQEAILLQLLEPSRAPGDGGHLVTGRFFRRSGNVV